MQYFDPQDVDEAERDLHEAIENGEFVPVANQEEEKAKAMAAAKVTRNKARNVNIRLSERDL
jgi:predicted DNA binding CopG/RHH family protein